MANTTTTKPVFSTTFTPKTRYMLTRVYNGTETPVEYYPSKKSALHHFKGLFTGYTANDSKLYTNVKIQPTIGGCLAFTVPYPTVTFYLKPCHPQAKSF